MVPINLGTGRGYTVLEVVRTFEKVTGCKVPIKVTDRREGDVAASYADPALARRLLTWKAEKTLTDMCRDAWRWQERNPKGYEAGAENAGSVL
jgi:UDP-glucose 4-epimerase